MNLTNLKLAFFESQEKLAGQNYFPLVFRILEQNETTYTLLCTGEFSTIVVPKADVLFAKEFTDDKTIFICLENGSKYSQMPDQTPVGCPRSHNMAVVLDDDRNMNLKTFKLKIF